MKTVPQTLLTLTLSAATALFAGCATDSRAHAGHTYPPAHTARNPCASKSWVTANPCSEKAAKPRAGEVRHDGDPFDPWGGTQPSDKNQSTETTDSWW